MLRLYCQFFTTSRHPWMSELLSVCDIEQNRNISVSVQLSSSSSVSVHAIVLVGDDNDDMEKMGNEAELNKLECLLF